MICLSNTRAVLEALFEHFSVRYDKIYILSNYLNTKLLSIQLWRTLTSLSTIYEKQIIDLKFGCIDFEQKRLILFFYYISNGKPEPRHSINYRSIVHDVGIFEIKKKIKNLSFNLKFSKPMFRWESFCEWIS